MTYGDKVKEQLTSELRALRGQIGNLKEWVNERRRIEDALKESEEFNSGLLETSPVAILVTNPDTSIRYVNPALLKITQFSSGELIGQKAPYPWSSDINSSDTFKELDEVRRNGSKKSERLFQKKNGEQFWVEVTLAPVKRGDKLQYYLQNWVDITERKHATYSLNRRITELQCHYGIARIASMRDITANEAFQQVADMLPSGCLIPEITSTRIIIDRQEFQTQNYHQTPWKYSVGIRLHGVRIGYIKVNRLEENTGIDQFPFSREEQLLIKATAATIEEIVERMHARELFTILSNNSPVGIYIVRDGKFQYVNPEFQEYSGYTEDELLGMSSVNLVNPDDRTKVRQNTSEMLEGQLSSPFEYRMLRKDGEVRWVLETVTPVTYEGKPATLGYYMDITKYKELEWDVNRYKELDNLKRNLLSTVSHELRTPLSNIKGYANMLIDYQQKLTDGQRREFALGIDKDTDRLTEFVGDLLNLSRLEAGLLKVEKKPRSITRLLRGVITEARVRTTGHQLTLLTEEKLARVNIDAKRIKQVLDNLIDNACKYSDEGTEIIISAEQKGSEMVIGVTDRGIGIPPEDLEKVFDPMYRVKHKQTEKIGGIGLGLSVCRGLVDAHGGRIWFESEAGKGSTCWFTLPLRANRSKSVRRAKEPV